MAQPTNREEFKEFCLRKLGKPLIEINVSDDQVDDRLDQALSFYADYHYDATEKIYYKHQVTSTDKANKYITIPDNIIGAVKVFNINDPSLGYNMFDIRYQIALNDLYTLTNTSLVPYYMAMEHLATIQELLVPDTMIRYSRHKNQLFIDMNWDRVLVDQYFLVEAYQVIDPEVYTDVWKDRWLQEYTTVLIKENWGENLGKFLNMSLPGGVKFNGDRILSEARQDKAKMEEDMIKSYSMPIQDFLF